MPTTFGTLTVGASTVKAHEQWRPRASATELVKLRTKIWDFIYKQSRLFTTPPIVIFAAHLRT